MPRSDGILYRFASVRAMSPGTPAAQSSRRKIRRARTPRIHQAGSLKRKIHGSASSLTHPRHPRGAPLSRGPTAHSLTLMNFMMSLRLNMYFSVSFIATSGDSPESISSL